MALVTAPRSRLCSSPSAWEQMGCQAMWGISGWSGLTMPSLSGVQIRLSRQNWEGVLTMCRFSACPRTTHTGTSSWSSAGATGPCCSRSCSYSASRSAASCSRRSPPGPRPCAGQVGGGPSIGSPVPVGEWLSGVTVSLRGKRCGSRGKGRGCRRARVRSARPSRRGSAGSASGSSGRPGWRPGAVRRSRGWGSPRAGRARCAVPRRGNGARRESC